MQRRLTTLPSILLVKVERGGCGVGAEQDRRPVRAEEQLALAALGHPNLELAGVFYERGARKSHRACRDAEGSFWLFGGGGEPPCLGQDLTDVLPSRVELVVYQRPGGAAEFLGARTDLAKPVVGLVRGLASAEVCLQKALVSAREKQLAELVTQSGERFWDGWVETDHVINVTSFRAMYCEPAHGGVVRACVAYVNWCQQVSSVLLSLIHI